VIASSGMDYRGRGSAGRPSAILFAPDGQLCTASHRQSMFGASEGLWQCVKMRKQYHEAGAGRRERW
jgi:hypothetical protein